MFVIDQHSNILVIFSIVLGQIITVSLNQNLCFIANINLIDLKSPYSYNLKKYNNI